MNGHLLVKPIEHKSILPSEKGLYEEIGEVVAMPEMINGTINSPVQMSEIPNVGDKVFYDGWRSAKYPTGDNEDDFIWLVRFEDVRAIQKKDV